MEFFHKVTRFPFMNTRKVWYGLSAVLILASFALVAVRGTEPRAWISPAAWWSRPISRRRRTSKRLRDGAGQGGRRRMRRCRPSAVRATSWCACRPIRTRKGDQIGARISEIFASVDPGVKLQRTEVVGPQVGQELFVKGGVALVATLVLILIYVLFRFTYKLALGAILAVLHDPICVVGFFALTPDDLRPDGDLGHPGGDRLFAERYRHRVRPYPRARPQRAQAQHRPGHRRIHQSNPVANPDDEAGDPAGGAWRC